MSWFSDLFGGGSIIKDIGGVVDDLTTSDEEKLEAKRKLQELVQKRDSEIEQTARKELEAKERVLVAELQQGDNYTKRARPTLVYFGLFIIFCNYTLIPTIQSFSGIAVDIYQLPVAFWTAWGGICTTWTIGRTAEKRGARSKLVQTITGNKGLLND